MADEGATPRELVLEACRRNNSELLEQVIADIKQSASGRTSVEKRVADVLNNAQDAIGNGALHLAALNDEVLDKLLDQEGLEIDNKDRMEGDTPLHKAVRFVNSVASENWQQADAVPDILLDAGCDPRIRNKAKLTACDLVDPRNTELRSRLKNAEFKFNAGDDVVDEDDDDADEDGGSGSD